MLVAGALLALRAAPALYREAVQRGTAVKVAYDWAKNRSDTLIVFTADHKTGDFDMTAQTALARLGAQTATTEYRWGLIRACAPIRGAVRTYTGIDPTSTEIATIQRWGPGHADNAGSGSQNELVGRNSSRTTAADPRPRPASLGRFPFEGRLGVPCAGPRLNGDSNHG